MAGYIYGDVDFWIDILLSSHNTEAEHNINITYFYLLFLVVFI